MRRLAAVLGVAAVAFVAVACGGNDDDTTRATTEERQVDTFTRVVLTEPIATTITVGGEQSVTVVTDTDLAADIVTEVASGILTVSVPQGFQARTPSEVRIAAPTLEGVAVTGGRAGTVVSVRQMSGDSFEAEVAGSTTLNLEGEIGTLDVKLSAAGALRAYGLAASNVAVATISTEDAQVSVLETLQADIGSSGNVIYRGDPEITQSISGSGQVLPG